MRWRPRSAGASRGVVSRSMPFKEVCWTSRLMRTSSKFLEAEADEPEAVREVLLRIAAMYQIEEQIRQATLTGESKRLYRLTHSKQHVDAFFDRINRQFERQGLT